MNGIVNILNKLSMESFDTLIPEIFGNILNEKWTDWVEKIPIER